MPKEITPARIGLSAAKWGACLVVLAFVIRHVAHHWHAVSQVDAPQWSWVFTGTAVALSGWLLNAAVFRELIAAHGYPVSYSIAAALVSIPMLAKYVPGKVLSVLASIWLFAREGIPKSVAFTCVGLNSILTLVSATALGFTASGGLELPFSPNGLALLVIALLLVGIHPAILYPCVNWTLRRLGRSEILSTLGFGSLLKLMVGKGVTFVLFGVGFWCVVRGFTDLSPHSIPRIIGVFVLAQVAGFLAVFAPAGLGVREGALIAGLTPIVGPGPAIVLTGVCRIWQTVTELSLIGAASLALRYAPGRRQFASERAPDSGNASAGNPATPSPSSQGSGSGD